MKVNFILKADSYKGCHAQMYPDGTESIFTYPEARGGRYPEIIYFGQQGFLLDNFVGKVFNEYDVDEAEDFYNLHGVPWEASRWRSLYNKYGGTLPIKITAPSEGRLVPVHNTLGSCETTDKEFFWLPGYLETQRLRGIWPSINVATHSFMIKRLILKYLDETADDPASEIMFKLHDFGARGVSSSESAQIAGAAHLVNFMGSDTIEGILYAQRYYGCANKMPAFSIPALEHSNVMPFIALGNENMAYERAVDLFAKPGSLFACVSDTTDLYHVVESVWGGYLGQRVKDIGATVVIRPDSGNPPEVIVNCLNLLKNRGLTTVNSKGFHVLQKHLRLIQGDGLEEVTDFDAILSKMKENGYSASNIAFGMGGGLLQKHNRDTQKMADKPSEFVINGKEYPVSKNPKTDHGKRSKSGRLKLVKKGVGNRVTTVLDVPEDTNENLLELVFENGELKRKQTLDEIRKIADSYL